MSASEPSGFSAKAGLPPGEAGRMPLDDAPGDAGRMPLVELTGSPEERGYQHGLALADKISSFVESIYGLHQSNLRLQVDRADLTGWCRCNLEYCQEYAPELVAEMHGIAEGTGVGFDDILLLNSMLELEDLRPTELGARLLESPSWGCTSFNVLSSATANGMVFVGQTYDMESYYKKFNTMFRIKHQDGHCELVYSLAGILGLNGMNSAGLGICINKLVANDARPGISYPLLIRKALASKRVGDAFGAILFARRACGMCYQISSSENIAWCAEVSATDFELLPIDGLRVHTNHYLSLRMRRYQTPGWLTHGGSYVREQAANNFLAGHQGSIELDDLISLTHDHTNYPRCICAHGFDGEDENSAFATIAATIYNLKSGLAYVCSGNPCEGEFAQFRL
jgi:isopenicillin-N N-acyltransferase-like protein